MSNVWSALVIFAVLATAIELVAWYRRRQQRREWERAHPGMSWKEWKHVHR